MDEKLLVDGSPDEEKIRKLKPNLMTNANFFSRLSFGWLAGLFKYGSKNTIMESDMFELEDQDKSTETSRQLEKHWNEELENEKRGEEASLLRALRKTYQFEILMSGIYILFLEFSRLCIPIFMGGLLRYFEERETTPVWKAYAYASAMSVLSIFLGVSWQKFGFMLERIGWHMRTSICTLMYKKTLRLSQKSISDATTGKIVNLSSTDVLIFDNFAYYLHYLWLTPLICVVVGIAIWNLMGMAVLAGMGTMLLILIGQIIIGAAYGKIRAQRVVITDKRIRIMNEIIAGIRIIKMYVWEKPFALLVNKVRRNEINKFFQCSMLMTIMMVFYTLEDKILTMVTIAVYIALGGEFTASQVFPMISLYHVVRLIAGYGFVYGISNLNGVFVSTSRAQIYLLLEEVSNVEKVEKHDGEDAFVETENLSACWYRNEDVDENQSLTLENISVRVDSGKLLAIIGPVGSGKSSILSAILGQLPTCAGLINVNGEITFANQVPWVFSGTVKENILFGETYNEDWYQKVIYACALTEDIASLPSGDKTLVGERGVTLSGGQKARVNLARAVYRKDASICLLDDPLSAVDAAVGNHIFQHCICGLLKDKVCILVTHQLRFLEKVDEIAMLKEGKILAFGTYSELQATSQEFHELLKEHELNEESVSPSSSSESNDDDEDNDSDQVGIRSPSVSAVEKFTYNQNNSFGADDGENTPLLKEGKKQYIDEEERLAGSVDWRVYLEYFQVGNNIALFFIVLITIAIGYALLIFCDWWIAQWAARTDHRFFYASQATNVTTFATNSTFVNSGNNHISVTEESTWIWGLEIKLNLFTGLYGAIIIGSVITLMSALMLSQYVCYKSSLNMHDKMFDAVIKAPIRFFDTNPVGRILNRFTMDLAHIDEETPETFLHVFFILGYMISIVIYSVTVSYLILLFALPMFIIAGFLVNYYLKTSRDVKRLEATTHSPVVSLLTSTLQGLPTIRAYKVENSFVERFYELQDINGAAVFSYLSGEHWMGIRLDLMSAFLLAFVTFLFLSTKSLLPIQSFQVGLSLTYINALSGVLDWLMTNLATLENDMTSAERIQQYYRIEPEAEDKIEHLKPTKWPVHGAINYKDVSFAYYEGGATILKNLSFNIKSQEKIGIIGRTGAGKSSLISALFRLAKLTGGEIYIDGIPITFLGLNDLRKVISIIPQDPVLFTGTMRYNLDPFSYYKDEELWNALEQVQLKEVVESLPLKLSSEIAESGSNFSVGQRQLVCLARAVLRKNKILVIDEATANVDLRTDRLIQLTIREKFKHCTVLTIAHRLNTIIDSDRVMVLDAGEVKEFDEPYALLQKSDSLFLKMVETTEGSEVDLLKRMAKEAYNLQNGLSVTSDQVKDKDRSYLTRFFPSPGSCDVLELESGV